MSKLNINLKDYKETIIIILTFIQIIVMFFYFNIKNEDQHFEEKNYSISDKLDFNEVNNGDRTHISYVSCTGGRIPSTTWEYPS